MWHGVHPSEPGSTAMLHLDSVLEMWRSVEKLHVLLDCPWGLQFGLCMTVVAPVELNFSGTLVQVSLAHVSILTLTSYSRFSL